MYELSLYIGEVSKRGTEIGVVKMAYYFRKSSWVFRANEVLEEIIDFISSEQKLW